MADFSLLFGSRISQTGPFKSAVAFNDLVSVALTLAKAKTGSTPQTY
jgi:hypothetical protein